MAHKNVLYFSAPWCAPCKAFAPQFDALMTKHDQVSYSKINIDDDFEQARTYGVRAIPCIVILEDGIEAARLAGGAVNKAKLDQLLG
jgi:thioredoxin 1